QLRGHFEHITQDKIFGGTIAQLAWGMLVLRAKEPVELTPTKCCNHQSTQVGEQVPKSKGEMSASLQEVIWQSMEVFSFCPEDETLLSCFVLIPVRAICCLVGEPKSHWIVSGEQCIAPCLEFLHDALFYQ